MNKQDSRVIRLIRENNRAIITREVLATYCLWFAWAPEGVAGPDGETVNNTYRPIAIDIEGAVSLEITANPADLWWHHPGNSSNAGGLNDERGLENSAYRSATYQSENILPLTARLNELVSMQGTQDIPTSEVIQERVGLGCVQNVGADMTRLFLGFHDGRQWTNNGGLVRVTVVVNF
ncbi:hypothetical protein Psta_0271 [Pirellula staleyi DSM 6068]|uniref:Uncharacterized protein n=1 Tax=Pirellula staleyi (strain ATCC 27377 / DSM 6068 / ICPB 4128) TaxID=530564 RepID=D2R1I1_PIRSD|nr:hypothetical protein [Pirellula staleyi]ADB14966.1 hypothetical protein Psta_0271 [Pirellula staleyi DSM 6068]